jgi:hypothetical protein
MADIDRRIAAAPPFPGLRRFPEGRGFKQWTGDDSKALMKVYLAAIAGHLPSTIVRAFSSFLEFCYLVRRNVIDEDCLSAISKAVESFHACRNTFIEYGVRADFNLPRQHSIKHYVELIREFGAPNGLCSSITESKHIEAVKEPYRRSSRYKALDQMLMTNQRLDKLAAFRQELAVNGMLGPEAEPSTSTSGDAPGIPAQREQQSDVGPVDTQTFYGIVRLARKRGTSTHFDLQR